MSPERGSGKGARGAVVSLTVPIGLEYRHAAIRLVASACRLVPRSGEAFRDEVVSAFGEALNNVVLHGNGPSGGELEVEIELEDDRMTLRLMDYGKSFDPTKVRPPDLENLPDSGLGTFIMRSFMDRVSYRAGSPNILTMTKKVMAKKSEP